MTQRHPNLHIIAFVGLEGSGKATAVEYLRQKGIPHVRQNNMAEQIEHLAEAGQHRIVTDELATLELYQEIKRAFAGQLTVVGITTNTKIRHMRLARDTVAPISEHDARIEDWSEAEVDAGPFALADYFIENNDNQAVLYAQIDELFEKLDLIG
jgi:dephospho-CoA kinase